MHTMKIQNILSEHPELQSRKKELTTLIEQFSAPKVPLDTNFKKQLDHKIHQIVTTKRHTESKGFSFYLQHFRYYFSGFSIALGCFLILFVLDIININKKIPLLQPQHIISYTHDEAF